MVTSILLAGVGGQGILLVAKIMAKAAELAGLDVCSNEIHGMAQRGGSVIAQIRFGKEVCSPLILEGTADAILALEGAEALRCAHFLKPGGFAAVSRLRILPVTVTAGSSVYPDEIEMEKRLRRVFPDLAYVDCVKQARELGDIRLANTLLAGVLAARLDLPAEVWRGALETCISKPAMRAINIRAFELGKDTGWK